MQDPAVRAARVAAGWHLAWLVGLGACVAAWRGEATLAGALGAAAAPGLVGLLLRWRRWGVARFLTILAWPAGIGAALWLTGGLTGPLVPLALAPAAAMAALDSRRLVALGTALSAAVLGALLLAQLQGLTPPPPAASPWLSLTAISVSAVGVAAALLIARARNAEREADSEDRAAALRRMLEAGPYLTLRLDGAGLVREVFSGAVEDADLELLGKPFESLAGEADHPAARAAVALARSRGAASVGFTPPMAPDRWLAAELRALPRGELLAVVRDATVERAREAHLEQGRHEALALAAGRSRFLANMSHELRTPLNAIIGFSDIMRTQLFGPMPEKYADYAGLIHESGGHLLDLINDVLDMSKIEAERYALSREPFDARESVAAALRLTRVQADAAKIQLRGILPSEPLNVDADRRALKQIVLNLVSNALKFTPAGGSVTVIARAAGEMLELLVADTGVGISSADLERLGRPYEQAGEPAQRAQGTGLGLSLVRAFAELHGGTMTLDSVLGEGTVVTVRLPVMVAEEDAAVAPPAPANEGGPPEPDIPPRPDNVIAFHPQR
ncbi:MAG: sensor histidine kinase [Caulobacterales bacterium]